ncbi:heparinase II/III family protein [Porticoccaceae bacterium]|nr:heparinase II/III family protein [Porticoccaceae bacterium]
MKKILLLLHTIRFLKWQQIYFRILRILLKPKVTHKFKQSELSRPDRWFHVLLYDEKIDSNLGACFLNHWKKLNLPDDWDNENPSKLWLYNLHYFEDLLSDNSLNKAQLHLDLLDLWIDQNPVGSKNSWEPYPTSLRIVNVLKAWLGGLELDTKVFFSIFNQASFLSNDLEKHILGNHYFVNLKALLFAGVIYDVPSWRKIAEEGLLSEIPEQILNDGANFELSPMYHSLMLVDMLDIANLSRSYPNRISKPLASVVQIYIPKMLEFMAIMSHPDGGLSFFNDSVDGIAPTKPRIEMYAAKLGHVINYVEFDKSLIFDNKYSGYMCAVSTGSKLIFDAASVGPDYIPGHAHADTLSFELSIGLQRFLVNSGISEYGLSSARINQRKTCSHNTVEVDGKDSSQVWSGFRVGKRARILERYSNLHSDQSVVFRATHGGYKSQFGGCLHTRQISLGEGSLSVIDTLKGSFKYAKSRLYFHPDLIISLDNNLLKVEGREFVVTSDLTGKSALICDADWHPEFGVTKRNKALEVEFVTDRLELMFVWTCI